MSLADLEPYESSSGPSEELGRTPPQDVAAEMSVLGGMMLSKDAIADVVEQIRGTDFYRPAHELIYDAIMDLYGRGEPADAITVAATLTRKGEIGRVGGNGYLHTLISSVPTAANAGYYARIVRERAVLRRLVEAGTRIVQLGYAAEGGDVDALVNTAQAEVYAVTDQRQTEDYVPLGSTIEATIDEIEASSHRGDGMIGVPTGFADLDALTNGLHGGQMIVIAARPAIGKALALDTPLPTPTGWTTMRDVVVGDEVLAADGTPTRVVAATEVMADRPCFEVVFDDGTTVVADAQHQWATKTRHERRVGLPAAVRTTEQIARSVRCSTADRRAEHSVDVAGALQLEPQQLPLSPYALGVWLGDGHTDAARFTTADPEIVAFVEGEGYEVRPVPGTISYSWCLVQPALDERTCVVCGATFTPRTSQVWTCGRSCGGRAKTVSPAVPSPTCPDCGRPSSGLRRCADCHADHGSVRGLLRGLGVLGDKHLPAAYLRASEQQRRDLLAGLLDSDGTVTPTGSVQFSVTDERLAQDVQELVLGLGYRCGVSTRRVTTRRAERSTCYTITFTTDDDVFRLERKRMVHKLRRRPSTARLRQRYVVEVRPVTSVPVRCIEIDHPSHLYLATRSMVPTHNSTIGLDILRSAAIKNNMPAVVFSLEMGKTEITMRLLSAEAKVPLQNMRKGTMREEDWTRLARTMGAVSEAPLFIDDSPNMTLMEIRAKCRRLKQQHGLKLVVIDYLQLMTSGKKVESRQQEVSEFSRALKLLAKELEVPVIAISQLNRGPEQRTDKRPAMSDLRESGCMTADTRLMRADTGAEVTLGELVANEDRDIPVWALNERLQLVPRTMTHAFPSGTREAFRLRLASGREVTATANHPFLTFDGWKPLGELAAGDRLGVVRHVPPPLQITAWDDDEVVLLAHLIGDGSMVARQPIRYASIDEANLTAVAEAAARRFGITAVRDEYAAARVTTLRLPAPYRLTHGKRNPIAAWLDGLGIFDKRSHEKFIPAGVFGLPKAQVAMFLRHLWSTDGCVHWQESQGKAIIYYASTSRRLVEDVARLLLRFNINARLKTVTKAGYRDGYQLHLMDVDTQRHFLTEIGCHGARGVKAQTVLERIGERVGRVRRDSVPAEVWPRIREAMESSGVEPERFRSILRREGIQLKANAPMTRQRLARVAEVLGSADLDVIATNDVFWDEVVSITPVGPVDVYDATVMGLHNFVANSIASHNSIEQDADMVILLHREDAYEKESPRAGEADLIVAKHRNGPTDTIVVAFQGHYSRFVDMATG
ncbi:replicative DNA helicase [Quadrisphaera oryzae]|uniref:replicative DNA helicase n=1 Tax=Quadrisphaera TaxID=317661 RepID=UPI0016476170|nr:replicative DNA helicase [Quadrisphaera sp. RL12-1S]MBC3764141.1 replicative DNA helicase [Quadrisphaera sp. RL12-1S]